MPPDLRVVSLHYSIQPDDGFSYDNPPPITFQSEAAGFVLEGGNLTCEMKGDFPDVKAAREVVEPVLRAWEAYADLKHNRGQLRFRFERSEVVDRSPQPSGAMVAVLGNAMATMSASASLHLTSTKYPDPPPDYFRLSPDAETLLRRYEGYLDHREPLPSMAYFALTLLLTGAGGLDGAAQKYHIHKSVLKKLSELSSTRGDSLSARKAGAIRPLSGDEQSWLEAIMKLLIQRLADRRPVTSLPELTLNALPKL